MNKFIIDVPELLLPFYRISPFCTVDSYKKKILKGIGELDIEKYFSNRFP